MAENGIPIAGKDENGDKKDVGVTGDAIKLHLSSSDVADSILDEYDEEIYSVAGDVATDGELITGLSPYTRWGFHVKGIDATGATLGIKIGLFGYKTESDFLAVRDASAAGQVVTIVADGVYYPTNAYEGAIFKDIFVDRIAVGSSVGTITVRALGRIG